MQPNIIKHTTPTAGIAKNLIALIRAIAHAMNRYLWLSFACIIPSPQFTSEKDTTEIRRLVWIYEQAGFPKGRWRQ